MSNRIYWQITGTCDYLWGYVPHVDITFVATEAVCFFPMERQRLLVYQKIERRQRGKTIQRHTCISINVLPSGLGPKPCTVIEATFHRVSGWLTLLFKNSCASKTRPTMCRTPTRKMNKYKTLFLCSRKLKTVTGEIIIKHLLHILNQDSKDS